MNGTFSHEYTIGYSKLNPDLTITLPGLVDFLQETATRHSEAVGFPMTWFSNEMKGWVITNWNLSIVRYPIWNDRVTVKTWPSLFKGVVAERSLIITDKNDNVILEGLSRWVFTDLKMRRPIRPDKEMVEVYGEVSAPPFTGDYKISLQDSPKLNEVSRKAFVTSRRDTDTNLHVNNVKYIEWALDLLPDDVYCGNPITNMRAVYKKECKKDTPIHTALYKNDDTYYAVISDESDVLALIEFQCQQVKEGAIL